MNYEEEYDKAFLCKNEQDFIECQKYFIKKGYKWYGSGDYAISYKYLFGSFKQTEIILILKKNNFLGWVDTKWLKLGLFDNDSFHKYLKTILEPYLSRKDKLKNILDDDA